MGSTVALGWQVLLWPFLASVQPVRNTAAQRTTDSGAELAADRDQSTGITTSCSARAWGTKAKEMRASKLTNRPPSATATASR